MQGLTIGKDGFIRGFAAAGPKVGEFVSDKTAGNQLELEGILRAQCAAKKPEHFKERVALEGNSSLGLPFKVAGGLSDFLDLSVFYSTMKTVKIEAAVTLYTEKEQTVTLQLWTFLAAAVYVNGDKVMETGRPVYKPILKTQARVKLRAGENPIWILGDTLGVRDTRTMLGLRLLKSEAPVTSLFPDKSCREQVESDIRWLTDINVNDNKVDLPDALSPACQPGGERRSQADARNSRKTDATAGGSAQIFFGPFSSPDFEKKLAVRDEDIAGRRQISVPKNCEDLRICLKRENYTLTREFHIPEHSRAKFSPDKRADYLFEKIAQRKSLDRGEFGFAVLDILARKALNIEDPGDHERILSDFELIKQRVDCADFLLTGYFRYRNYYGFTPEEEKAFQDVLKDFRFWMNMQGHDGMCFWSENHSLMFYSAAMFAGKLYPDLFFTRAQMSGADLSSLGRRKVLEWLQDVEENGFEEFLSTVYMPVTLAAVLNLVDLAGPEISTRAAKVCDSMLREMALQTFKGVQIAPMGRVYSGVIRPYQGSVQSLLYLMDPSVPFDTGEGWPAFLLTSRYHLPKDLKELAQAPIETEYSSGNALIRVCKQESYILTSVQSPRMDGKKRWKNTLHVANVDTDTQAFNRSLNETFHGTSCFEPGTFGYQQHLFYAALSPEAVCFVNHPGTDSEESDMRPGYWFGNGLMPAVRQEGKILGAIWHLNDTQPMRFTHLYLPVCKFDEVREEGPFILARKDAGFLAVWHSDPLEDYNEGSMAGVEKRCYSENHAWLFVVGDAKEYESFETFAAAVRHLRPEYDKESGTLRAGDFSLHYVSGHDKTQFVP